MDIFDEEDLLAIANDEDSSSSHADDDSCASNGCADADGSTKADAGGGSGVKKHSGASSVDDGNKNVADEDSDDDFLDSWLTDLKNCERKYQEKMLETCNDESSHRARVKDESCKIDVHNTHDNDTDDDTCTSDEDREKQLETTHRDSHESILNEASSEVANDYNCEYAVMKDVATSGVGDIDEIASKNDKNALGDSIEIQLGSSVLRWISDYHSEKRSMNKRRKVSALAVVAKDKLDNDAIIGLQRDFKGSDDPGPFSSCLLVDLRKNNHNGKAKRPAASQHTAIIETTNPDVFHDDKSILPEQVTARSKEFIGDAVLCASREGRKGSAMIDCLARYDPDKKCYILDLVEMTVSNLHSHSVDDGAGSNDGPPRVPFMQPEPLIVDPRIRAQKAEDQVRKLKRGKRVF
eukprot:CCRYP_009097-RA/>CCRYP_009097-RA protein AED:0.27 eAED:0.27 QI:110/1/1/1/0/0/3/896/407